MTSPIVTIAAVHDALPAAFDEIWAPYGGVQAMIPPDATVYVKPNGVHFTPYAHTDPAVLEALLAYLRDHGYARLVVMESCTGGNFTRLVFRVTGYERICRRYGAQAIYLDEGVTAEVSLCDGTRVRLSRRFRDQILHRSDSQEAFYLSLPKLKTHPMSTVTLGVKNQQAFPIDADRMAHHNHRTLHRRLAALYKLVRPDFCILEGLTATAHGHIPVTGLHDKCLVPMGILVGGQDTLAVDVVGARILGYGLEEVEHLRLCAEWGLGQASLRQIDLRGVSLERFARRLPHTLLRRFHPDVTWVVGRQRACSEGCRGNSEAIQEMLYANYGGHGGWTLICGAGFQEGDLESLPGDLLVVGPCACDEIADLLRRRYPDRRLYLVAEHNDLMANTRHQARLMGVMPVRMVPLHPLVSALTLLQAKLHGLHARVPPLLDF